MSGAGSSTFGSGLGICGGARGGPEDSDAEASLHLSLCVKLSDIAFYPFRGCYRFTLATPRWDASTDDSATYFGLSS